jgi:GNAT superfamily N-acetyltransferase
MTITTVIARPELSSLATISPIAPEQFSDMRALHRLAVVSSRWRYYAPREIAAKLLQIDSPEYTLQLMAAKGLAASLCGTLIGTAFWSADPTLSSDASLAELYVHPAYIRGGVATRLVHTCERLAGGAGFRRMRAHVDLVARPLFAKLGYQRESYERNQIDPDACFPLLVMTRLL